MFNPEEAEVCKRRGHSERPSEERWRQSSVSWFRQVCSLDERQDMPADTQPDSIGAARRKRLKIAINKHKLSKSSSGWLPERCGEKIQMTKYQVLLTTAGPLEIAAAKVNLGVTKLWFYDDEDHLLAVFRWDQVIGLQVVGSAKNRLLLMICCTSKRRRRTNSLNASVRTVCF